MKRFVIALMILCLLLPLAARADGPDDRYVTIYSLIQVGDMMADKGQTAVALARYNEAQNALIQLQKANPTWNVNLVQYRLKYLATKISQLSANVPAPAPVTVPSVPTAPAVTPVPTTAQVPVALVPVPTNPSVTVPAPATSLTAVSNSTLVASISAARTTPPPSAETENKIRDLQAQIQRVTADKALVEAKLKEALAAQPTSVDPHEFAKAQEQIKGLQKENELLKASLAEAKTNLIPAGTSKETLRDSLAEANRKLAQLTEANAALAAEKQALQAQVKTSIATDATVQALRDENALLKKQLADLKSRGATATGSEALKLKLQEAETQVATLQSDKQILHLEKIALEIRVKQLSRMAGVPNAIPVEVPAPAVTNVAPTASIASVPTPIVTNITPAASTAVVPAPVVANAVVVTPPVTNTVPGATNPVPAEVKAIPADTTAAPMLDSVTSSRIAQLEAQRDELQKSLDAATHDIAGRKKGKLLAEHIDDMTRQLAGLRARIEVYESRQIPYSAEELALLGKPDGALLTTSMHDSTARKTRELPASAAVLVAEAQRYYTAHDFDKAEQKYLEILKLDDKNVTTLMDLASIQIDAGREAEAEKNLKAALVIDPSNDHCLYILGRLRFEQMSYTEALDYLSRAAQLAPQNAKIENFLGLTLSAKGQRGPAETAFRKAIQIDPGFADAHLNLAVVYATQQPPLLELARWHYQKAVAAGHPTSPKLEAILDPNRPATP